MRLLAFARKQSPQAHTMPAVALLLACACGFAAFAEDAPDPADAALALLPEPAPGPAFPGIDEVDMNRLCAPRSRARRPYLERALEDRVNGRVVLDCVIEGRRLRTCQVLHERPASYDFAAAALNLACGFRVRQTEHGEISSSENLPSFTRFYRRNADGEPWRARIPVRFVFDRGE